jgi:hypothetical protein
MLCNTWLWDGRAKYRGFRPFGAAFGAELSQHKFGRALDLIPLENSVDMIRSNIISRQNEECFKDLTALEMKVSWLHVDVRNHNKAVDGLFCFNP